MSEARSPASRTRPPPRRALGRLQVAAGVLLWLAATEALARPREPDLSAVPTLESVVEREGWTVTPTQSNIYRPGVILIPDKNGSHVVLAADCVEAQPDVQVLSETRIASSLRAGVHGGVAGLSAQGEGSVVKQLTFVDPEQRTIALIDLELRPACFGRLSAAAQRFDIRQAIVVHDVLVAIVKTSTCSRLDASGRLSLIGSAEASALTECVQESPGQVPVGYKAVPLDVVAPSLLVALGGPDDGAARAEAAARAAANADAEARAAERAERDAQAQAAALAAQEAEAQARAAVLAAQEAEAQARADARAAQQAEAQAGGAAAPQAALGPPLPSAGRGPRALHQQAVEARPQRGELALGAAARVGDPFMRQAALSAALTLRASPAFGLQLGGMVLPALGERSYTPVTRQLVDELGVAPDLSAPRAAGWGAFAFEPLYLKGPKRGFAAGAQLGVGLLRTVDDLDALGVAGDPRYEATEDQRHIAAYRSVYADIGGLDGWALRLQAQRFDTVEVIASSYLERASLRLMGVALVRDGKGRSQRP